jgi:predicted dehydrogenase
MDPIGMGILGFAHGHIGMYCERWRKNPDWGVRLVAGWDADAARATAGCTAQGIEPVGTAAELLARRDVGAVVITSETARHAELVEQATMAGKAIILQKPLSLTMAEADRMVAAVGRAKVPFTLAWQMRVDPHNLQIRALLAEGRFGRVFMARRRHCLPTQQWKDFDKTWHVNPALNRDIFADDAAHALDFIYWLRGRPVSVMAELGTLGNPAIPNDNAIVVFRHADRSFSEVSCTFNAVAGETVTEIVCERGVIIGQYGDVPSCNNPWPAGGIQLKWYLDEEKKWTVSELPEIRQHGERIAGLAQPLAEFLTGRRPALATVEEGREVLRMVLACYASAEQGRRIEIESI